MREPGFVTVTTLMGRVRSQRLVSWDQLGCIGNVRPPPIETFAEAPCPLLIPADMVGGIRSERTGNASGLGLS